MMMQRPLPSTANESFEVDFDMCEQHWRVLKTAFNRHFITKEEAVTSAKWIALACTECSDPVGLDLHRPVM